MNRQEGYYWVKFKGEYIIAEWIVGNNSWWNLMDTEKGYGDSDFEHINEVKIKKPGELPD